MKALRRAGKAALIAVTGFCLLLGGLLIWAGQSWYGMVWLAAKAAFPGSGAHVVMVNTEATSKRRSDYSLPDELVHNIALRALIVDKRGQVMATAWREGYLIEYPEPAVRDQNPRLSVLHIRVIGWLDVLRVTGWLLVLIGGVHVVAICFIEHSERKVRS